MSRTRSGFWSEAVYSQTGAVIPSRVRRGNERVKWSINAILGELLRLEGHCGHVEKPAPTLHVHGLPPERLRERVDVVYKNSLSIKEPYTRRGKNHLRRQKKSTPTVLMAVASWPEPNFDATETRNRWERRVVRAAKSRWGNGLIGVYAHTDESFYHLHLWVDNNGHPVKRLHAGFGAVACLLEERPGATRAERGLAYKAGTRNGLDWYHHWVGQHFGMARKSESPRPRFTRAGALRARQEKVEAMEAEAAADMRMIAAARAEVLEHTSMLKKALARLQAREAALEQKAQAVEELLVAVEDQLEVEERVRRNRSGSSLDFDLFS